MQRVVVIGNGGGGKSTLSQAISQAHELPWHEVDTVQFLPGWERAPDDDVRTWVHEVIATDRWVLDGFGPKDTWDARCDRADTLVFVDHPLWVHFWWAAERQIAAALGQQRLGGPEGCDLRDINERMFRMLWHVHNDLRPDLLSLVERHRGHLDLHHIQSPEQLDAFLAQVRGSPS